MNPFVGLIEERDIRWASELMGLGPDGFSAVDGDDSRREALLNTETADFEACPGSGKTTLLVAKLAMLARRWPHRHRGICVLSHTNVARDEIEGRLFGSSTGSALVRYPHFVGTIHSFVNEYLAIPWLRSKGNPVRLIDTEATLRKRMAALRWGTKRYLEEAHLNEFSLTYDAADYSGGSKGSLKPHTATYKELVAVARRSSEDGYFCFDEMFVWANELLDRHPDVVTSLRVRFPIVFIDEAQDNREIQADLLHRLFLEGEAPSKCQRFGDSNQAIYTHAEEKDPHTDRFPAGVIYNLARSYRFAQAIADLANGLGVSPQGLVGAGPSKNRISSEPKPPTIFLFDDTSVCDVLAKYAECLTAHFSDEELRRGSFVAIAGVHKASRDETVPRGMGHYAPTYDPLYSRRQVTPQSLWHYLERARQDMTGTGDAHPVANGVASAIFALNELRGVLAEELPWRSSHSRLMKDLTDPQSRADYLHLLEAVIELDRLDCQAWHSVVLPRVRSVAVGLTGSADFNSQAEAFLAWSPKTEGTAPLGSKSDANNIFVYPPEAPKVQIRLDSIHSVKGETHTATLVLESYSWMHQLAGLKPWLLGQRNGGSRTNGRGKTVTEGVRTLARLKLHYVAMTRPTHLLCLAMRRDAFTHAELDTMRARGWQVVDCCETDGTPQVLSPEVVGNDQ